MLPWLRHNDPYRLNSSVMSSNNKYSLLRCSIKYKPPLLAVTYKDLITEKTRRHTIPLRGFARYNDVKAYGDKLLRNPKHCDYVSKLPRQQLDSLLHKVKDGQKGHGHSTNQPTPSPAHTSLLDIPPLTTPTHAHETDKLNQEFDDALAELLGPEDDVADSSKPQVEGSTIPSSLGKLPPLNKLPPLKPPDLKSEIGAPLLLSKESSALDEEVPDYSADFNSESERSRSIERPAVEDKSLSFALEELEGDDSLSLSFEGEDFAGDNLLGGSSGEDFRAMNIITPPPQAAESDLLVAMTNGDEDLNKADDSYLAKRKAEMETVFQANQVKPGDDGYEYDREVNFEGPKIESGWDSDDGSMSDF